MKLSEKELTDLIWKVWNEHSGPGGDIYDNEVFISKLVGAILTEENENE
jgi:hypothetical protein